MKRRLLSIAMFLLLGAAINVAVAWGCGLWASTSRSDDDVPGIGWPNRAPLGWPEPDRWSYSRGLGLTIRSACENLEQSFATQMLDPSVVVHWMAAYDFGLPMRAMRSTRRAVQRGRAMAWPGRGGMEWGWPLPPLVNRGFAMRRLAFVPIWPGFAVNTVLYALIAWSIGSGTVRLRRARRRRRGRCVACAYDVSDLDTCPECGKAVIGTAPGGTARRGAEGV